MYIKVYVHLKHVEEAPTSKLRLIKNGTNNTSEGRLEILYKGEWGTVCNSEWDIRDATVACRQLGYNYALRSASANEFGRGEGRIWISAMGCTGNETHLLLCDHGGLGTGTCDHSSDVGLVCSS